MPTGSRSHHLLKHALPEVDVKEHFGSNEPKEITREINRLGQRELQAKFRAVYGTQTFSNNNNWLRRKLLEAAGLQTPKAASRGRPSARQPRAISPGSAPGSDSTSLSRSGSVVSHSVLDRPPSPVSAIRRTKRARKPRCFEDMLMLPHASAGVHSDDEDQHGPAKYPMTASCLSLSDRHERMASSSSSAVPLSTTDLVWGPSPSQGCYSVGQILVSPEGPNCAWPATPDSAASHHRRAAAHLSSSYGVAVCQLLGALPAAGDAALGLPDWARLGPGKDTAAADAATPDAPDAGLKDMRRSSSGLFAPSTPPRPTQPLLPLAGSTPPTAAAAAVAAAFGAAPHAQAALLPFGGPADFDCFAFAPSAGCDGCEALLPVASEADFAAPAPQEFGIASSDASDISVLDMMLEELSSHQELSDDLSTLAPLEGMWEGADCA